MKPDAFLTTRRDFLGSLLVLPSLGFIPKPLVKAAERIIVPDRGLVLQKYGVLEDLILWYRPDGGGKYRDLPGSFEVVRIRGGEPLLTLGLNVRSTFRWVAAPGHGFVVNEKNPVMVYAERVPGHVGHIWTNLGGDDTSQMSSRV